MANVIPKTCANLETSLATAISSSAASLTAASITTDDGVVLPSGTYGITVDQGTNQQEHMIVSFAGTTAGTIITRGVSVIDGTTNIPALQFAHARGASIKFTDHPVLIRILRVIQGTDTLDSKLSYTSHPTFSSNTELIDKKYADDLAIAGAPDASTIVKGIVEAATDAELQAGTATGATGALLAATGSSFKQAGTANKVPVGDSNGKLAASWGGSASTLATLNGSSKVVEDPANATATPTASKIPIADASGTLNGWSGRLDDNSRTTGEAIDGSTTPQAVCVAVADGLIYKADANTSTRVNAYGFITTNALITTTPYVKVAGIVGGFAGLTVGAMYYVTDTAGSISTTPSTTCIIPVGRAISATQIELSFGKKTAYGRLTHSAAAGATDDQTATVGFRPAKITLVYDMTMSGSNSQQGKGYTVWFGTTLQQIFMSFPENTGAAVTETSFYGTSFFSVDETQPIEILSSGANRGRTTMTINSLSSTGFVSRAANVTVAGSGGTGSGTVSYIVEE